MLYVVDDVVGGHGLAVDQHAHAPVPAEDAHGRFVPVAREGEVDAVLPRLLVDAAVDEVDFRGVVDAGQEPFARDVEGRDEAQRRDRGQTPHQPPARPESGHQRRCQRRECDRVLRPEHRDQERDGQDRAYDAGQRVCRVGASRSRAALAACGQVHRQRKGGAETKRAGQQDQGREHEARPQAGAEAALEREIEGDVEPRQEVHEQRRKAEQRSRRRPWSRASGVSARHRVPGACRSHPRRRCRTGTRPAWS